MLFPILTIFDLAVMSPGWAGATKLTLMSNETGLLWNFTNAITKCAIVESNIPVMNPPWTICASEWQNSGIASNSITMIRSLNSTRLQRRVSMHGGLLLSRSFIISSLFINSPFHIQQSLIRLCLSLHNPMNEYWNQSFHWPDWWRQWSDRCHRL